MPKILSEYLKGIKKDSLLVVHHNGKPFNKDDWQYAWKKYREEIGIDTTIHCLRHTYCTLLYEAGIDVLTAKLYMGHSDIQTTMNIYTHLRDEKEKASVTKLDEYLSPKDERLVKG